MTTKTPAQDLYEANLWHDYYLDLAQKSAAKLALYGFICDDLHNFRLLEDIQRWTHPKFPNTAIDGIYRHEEWASDNPPGFAFDVDINASQDGYGLTCEQAIEAVIKQWDWMKVHQVIQNNLDISFCIHTRKYSDD